MEEAISYLITKGWNLKKLRPIDFHSIPHKQKMVCVRKPFLKKKLHRVLTLDETYLMYEPEVPDLSKVDLKPELQVGCSKTCVHAYRVSEIYLVMHLYQNSKLQHRSEARSCRMVAEIS